MPGRLAFGFEASEQGRAERAREYDTPHRVAEFPLIEWGWDRAACLAYIREITGVTNWPKSACQYCPFSLTSKAGREHSLARYDTRPEAALQALMLERRSLCLNPRGGLIAGDRLADLIAELRPALAARFERQLDREPHAVYEVRACGAPRPPTRRRSPTPTATSAYWRPAPAPNAWPPSRPLGDVDRRVGIARVYRERRGELLPAREHFIVAGPAGAIDKSLPSFDSWWSALNDPQLSLGPAA